MSGVSVVFSGDMTDTTGTLPPGWQQVALGEVCDVVMGQSPPSETYNTTGYGLPFLQGKAEFSDLSPRPEKYCSSPNKVARQGSVLMSVRAPVGDVNIADQDYAIGRGLAALRLTNGSTDFLFYALLRNKARIAALGSGTTFQSINRATIDTFTLLLPPLTEQHAIARALNAVQDAIQTRRREREVERERKVALMQHLFTKGTRGEPTKQTEIGEMPESWDIAQLGAVSECLDYRRIPVNAAEREGRLGPVPYYGASGLAGWIDVPLFDENLLLVAEDGENLVSRKLPIAYSIAGPSWVNNHAHVLRLTGANQRFVEYYLNQAPLSPYLSDGTRPKLNQAQLKTIAIPLPHTDEQDEIGDLLRCCGEKLSALSDEIDRLDELFRAMLEELMAGRLSSLPLVEHDDAEVGA